MATKQNATLSKSSYIRSLQCLKSLFLYKHYYQYRDIPSPELLQRFSQGIKFGKQAWKLFPNGLDVSPKSNFPSAIFAAAQQTLTYIENNDEITLYEASFVAKPTLIILDILQKKNNQLFAYEVKSSAQITETYLNDAAFQYYVMSQSGFSPQKFCIIHLHNNAKLENVSIEDFIITDVTDIVEKQKDKVKSNIEKAMFALQNEALLKQKMGEQCNKPYLCDFYNFCTKQEENNNKTEINWLKEIL